MASEILMPQLGMFAFKGTIVRWLVADGARVQRGDGLVEIQTEKVVTTIEAAEAGVVQRAAAEGDTLPTRGLIGYLLADGEARVGAEPAVRPEPGPAPGLLEPEAPSLVAERQATLRPPDKGRGETALAASPVARKLAAAHGLDLALVVGTGPGGRIVERDVQAAIAGRDASSPGSADHGASQQDTTGDAPQHDIKPEGQVHPVEGVRGVIFERMARSARTVARVTELMEADATELVALRARLNAEAERMRRPRLGYNELLVRIVAAALRAHPEMNARCVDGADGRPAIERPAEVNVGLAVDTEAGLMVPVVRGADRRGLWEIAAEVRALVERARAGQSRPDDLTGGTFTITNLGMYEVDGFTPIVNLPECAILGVGRIAPRPVVRGGQIVARQTVTLSLAFDHRLVDGAPAARFLLDVKRFMEDPHLLLLG